jgi:hypothetical protein
MDILGISSYPLRWRRSLWAASLLDAVIVLEGIGTLVWYLVHPSESASRFFLSYSLGRWGLILFTSLLVILFIYVLWTIRNRQKWTTTVIEYFEGEKQAAGLLAAFTIMSLLMLVLHIGLYSNQSTRTYYQQLLPLLAFLTLVVLEIWIFLLLILRQADVQILKIWFPVYQENKADLKEIGRNLLIGFAVISFFYLAIQVGAGIHLPKAVELGDTTSYLEGARLKLSDPAFFSERRPWGILLIYKLLGGSLTAIGLAQLAFSTMAWLFLAWMLAGSLKTSTGKLLGFITVLGIGLSPTVQAWNHAGLSESFSISMMIVILALFIGLLQRWRLSFFLFLIFFFTLWLSIHEVNLYLGLLASSILFIIGLTRKNYRTFLILSFCIVTMAAVNSYLSSLYALPRWALPVAEVITKRILPVPEYREYFSNQGMPVTPELMALSGRWANSDNYAILNSRQLRDFSKWLFMDGKTVYTRFLITHPIYTLTLPLVNVSEMLAVDFSQLIPGYRPALPAIVNELFFPVRWFWFYLGLSVVFIGIILWKQRREGSRAFWLIVLFIIISIPYLYLAWHGDALDLARHAAVANIQFHLGTWLLFVFYLDKRLAFLLSKRGESKSLS